MHFPINDFPEIINPVCRADGNKIWGIPTIIPILHTGRRDAVFGLEFIHYRIMPLYEKTKFNDTVGNYHLATKRLYLKEL
jgi:hypothetical protein